MTKKPKEKAPSSSEHPRFSVMDEGRGYRVTLVDIGLDRDSESDNSGFGDWDGYIDHKKTTPKMHTLKLMFPLKNREDWTIDRVRETMSAYVAVFQSIGETVEEYDFSEITVGEETQWEPISAMPQWNPAVEETDDGE